MSPSVSGAADQSVYRSFDEEHSSRVELDEIELDTGDISRYQYDEESGRVEDGMFSYADEGITRDSMYGPDEQQEQLGGLQQRRARRIPSAASSTGDAYAQRSYWSRSPSHNITATSGFSSHGDLEAMDLSTHSAGGVARQTADGDVTGDSYYANGEQSSRFDDRYDEESERIDQASFHSDGQVTMQHHQQMHHQHMQQQQRRSDSFHGSGSRRRLERLARRYQDSPRAALDHSVLELSTRDEPSNAADTPEDTGNLSIGSSRSHVSSSNGQRNTPGRIAPSVVERMRQALHQRMALDAQDAAEAEAEADTYSREQRAEDMRGYARHGGSFESLEHPNMGSQMSDRSFGSLGSFAGRRALAEPDSPFGASVLDEVNESPFGSVHHDESPRLRESPAGHSPFAAESDTEDPVAATPAWSDMVRDHEHTFASLATSDLDDDEERAPASLFAASASIEAALGSGARWDARETTRRVMREQEQRFGLHQATPLEMLGKASSLGVDSASDVSGGLPGLPTTPRTFLARDRRHRPVSRDPQRISAMTPPLVQSPLVPQRILAAAEEEQLTPAGKHTPPRAGRPPALHLRGSPARHPSAARMLQRAAYAASTSSTPASTRSYVPFQEPTIDVSRVVDYSRIAPAPMPRMVAERPISLRVSGGSRSPTVACSPPGERPVAPTPRRAAPVFRRFVADKPGWDAGCAEPLAKHPEIARMRSEDG
ncbi:hypothetical protein IW150_003232, partial [Coemansia sp. RSA 2607]